MLRTGLMQIDGEKLAKVQSDMRSVSLSHVTPITVVLASGVFMATFIGAVERLLLRRSKRRGIMRKIRSKPFQNTTHCISQACTWSVGELLTFSVLTFLSIEG
jgi:hypothetical protein